MLIDYHYRYFVAASKSGGDKGYAPVSLITSAEVVRLERMCRYFQGRVAGHSARYFEAVFVHVATVTSRVAASPSQRHSLLLIH